jgi:hypothetical protein
MRKVRFGNFVVFWTLESVFNFFLIKRIFFSSNVLFECETHFWTLQTQLQTNS